MSLIESKMDNLQINNKKLSAIVDDVDLHTKKKLQLIENVVGDNLGKDLLKQLDKDDDQNEQSLDENNDGLGLEASDDLLTEDGAMMMGAPDDDMVSPHPQTVEVDDENNTEIHNVSQRNQE